MENEHLTADLQAVFDKYVLVPTSPFTLCDFYESYKTIA